MGRFLMCKIYFIKYTNIVDRAFITNYIFLLQVFEFNMPLSSHYKKLKQYEHHKLKLIGNNFFLTMLYFLKNLTMF